MKEEITRRRALGVLLATTAAGASLPVYARKPGTGGGTLPDPATAPPLRTYFESEFEVGMAVSPYQFSDSVITSVVNKHASSLVAENDMKPHVIGVGPGTYNFGPGDEIVAYAEARGMVVRGHTLLWHSSAPEWFFAGDATSPGYAATVENRLITYVTDVVRHFAGKVHAWDVVNEVISDDSTQLYRSSRWYQVLGPSYIETALRAARAADATVQLFINDYSTEDPGKLSRLMSVVDDLRSRGVPLDGIGHQMHINISWPPVSNVASALSAVEARGLINHITELDVSLYDRDAGSCHSNPPLGCQSSMRVGSVQYKEAIRQQALQYRAMYNLFAQRESVTSVTTWGVCDKSTWLATWPTQRTNHPLLFDASGKPKSAFWAVVDPNFGP